MKSSCWQPDVRRGWASKYSSMARCATAYRVVAIGAATWGVKAACAAAVCNPAGASSTSPATVSAFFQTRMGDPSPVPVSGRLLID